MSRKNPFFKLLFFVNSVAALFLTLAYIFPYISPKSFPLLSVLSLFMPALIAVNIAFCLFWLLLFSRRALLSLVVVLIGFSHISSFYKWSSTPEPYEASQLKIMSFNVRDFNYLGWIDQDDIPVKIKRFIEEESPDIISFQEYFSGVPFQSPAYPYKYVHSEKGRVEQAVFSRIPLLDVGAVNFPHSANAAVFVDFVYKKDTIRLYNLHFESLKINPENDLTLEQEASKRLVGVMKESFQKQQEQMELILSHQQGTSYKTIFSGDFNNLASSFVYRKLMKGHKDTFKEKGKGLGKTYILKKIPLRIDMILVDKDFKVKDFKTYSHELSDHYPIMTTLDL